MLVETPIGLLHGRPVSSLRHTIYTKRLLTIGVSACNIIRCIVFYDLAVSSLGWLSSVRALYPPYIHYRLYDALALYFARCRTVGQQPAINCYFAQEISH